jgi:hypothetical protein
MKLDQFTRQMKEAYSIESIATTTLTPAKVTFRSAYLHETILKIAVKAKTEGFDYEIVPAQRAGGLLAIIVTPRQLPISAKYDAISMMMTPFRETDV